MVFKKEKMVARVTKEGRAEMIDDEVIEMMDNLDGCFASTNCWRRVVYGEPVLWVVGKNGEGAYVNENDCEII